MAFNNFSDTSQRSNEVGNDGRTGRKELGDEMATGTDEEGHNMKAGSAKNGSNKKHSQASPRPNTSVLTIILLSLGMVISITLSTADQISLQSHQYSKHKHSTREKGRRKPPHTQRYQRQWGPSQRQTMKKKEKDGDTLVLRHCGQRKGREGKSVSLTTLRSERVSLRLRK